MQAVIYIVAVICLIIVAADVWRSPATTATKLFWTVAAVIFSILTLIVWFAWGRNRAYSGSGPTPI